MLNITRKNIFLFDASGALLTAIRHGKVLPEHVDVFGLPLTWLLPLSGLALCYACFSFIAHLRAWHEKSWALKAIASANALFCLLTLAMVIIHRGIITDWGLLYLALEMVVVAWLVNMEWKFAQGTPT